ncbi:MAG TPA: CsgG/HfaB family protein [Methylocystis sp.]|nr:CsgG/HfaB family protein [Methylocystis sp.]
MKRFLLASCVLLSGCAQPALLPDLLEQPPVVTPPSAAGLNLESLPPPKHKIDIAVYQFPDLTGKNEPNDTVAVFSRAVTQGGAGLLIDSLTRAGNGRWFSVVERTGLNDLLQERQLVRATRQEYDKDLAKPLPPIRFAGLLAEGGILTYDANTMTGGIGANLLGINANANYRRDVVTVGLRIVSVQTGEVLLSVTTTKTVYSVGLQGSVYRYVSQKSILQAETGVTRTEPTQLAVRQAIDLAVYSAIVEGAQKKLWRFSDPWAEELLIEEYHERDKPRPPGDTIADNHPQAPAEPAPVEITQSR